MYCTFNMKNVITTTHFTKNDALPQLHGHMTMFVGLVTFYMFIFACWLHFKYAKKY